MQPIILAVNHHIAPYNDNCKMTCKANRILSLRRAASIVFGDSLLKYLRTPLIKLMKYTSHSSVVKSMLYSFLSAIDCVLMSAFVLLLWNFHSVNMNFSNNFNELQTFVCNLTRIGRPPLNRVTVSRI